jgi:hypothetical protein
LPYALTVGLVSLAACWLSTWLGGGWLISGFLLISGFVILYLVVLKLGKKIVDYAEEAA